MDPKQSAPLDPKLQEVYDRVMGVATQPTTPQPTAPVVPPSVPTPSVPTPNPLSAAPSPVPTPIATPTPTASTPTDMPIAMGAVSATPAMPAPSAMPQMSASALDSANPAPAPQKSKFHSFVAKKSMGLKVSPAILVVGAVAFLLLYSVIWIKVFNLSVPIINP